MPPTLQKLIAEPPLRGRRLRGLAAYDDAANAARRFWRRIAGFSLEEKRDALNTLAARVPYATALLAAVGDKKIAGHRSVGRSDPPTAQPQEPSRSTTRIGEVWGIARDSSGEKAATDRRVTRSWSRQKNPPTDVSLGRAVFAKTCQQCHTLFGAGGKIGPELTGSNRANLDYLLSNMLDPGAVMAKEYQPSVIVTADGRVITGIVKSQDADALTRANRQRAGGRCRAAKSTRCSRASSR